MSENELVEYSCKIVQGIVSNPCVKISFERSSLFLQFGDNEGKTNIATIFECVKKGLINGINAQKIINER